MRTKSNANAIIDAMLRMQKSYYLYCDSENLDTKKHAIYIGHFISFCFKNINHIKKIINTRENGKTK